MAKNKKSNKKYVYAVGRRRASSARIRLFRGKDQHLVNDMPIGKYFPGDVARYYWNKPFELTETEGKYYVTAKVIGGGKSGQLGAVVHGIARALVKANPDKFKKPIKSAGLLTRDARVKERRKVGTGGKARRQKQSPKR